ncbi:P-loop NTPase fold protein, partial [Klebsiella variicola]|uniref:P-loop NTPase fold protein n=2 Tax=Klebsiella pneumoniae complex TaxID=3390273 RepID=UPI00223228F8
MTNRTELSRAGFEGPVDAVKDDRYGFTAIAQGLAASICALDENISTVIGIEGRWGAGKTSLMYLLSTQLKCLLPPETQIIPYSPWLNSPDESPVTSLLLTIAARLERFDVPAGNQSSSPPTLTENILNYAQ